MDYRLAIRISSAQTNMRNRQGTLEQWPRLGFISNTEVKGSLQQEVRLRILGNYIIEAILAVSSFAFRDIAEKGKQKCILNTTFQILEETGQR